MSHLENVTEARLSEEGPSLKIPSAGYLSNASTPTHKRTRQTFATPFERFKSTVLASQFLKHIADATQANHDSSEMLKKLKTAQAGAPQGKVGKFGFEKKGHFLSLHQCETQTLI